MTARRPSGWHELALIVGAWLGYFGVRAISEGSTASAERHAGSLYRVERSLGLAWEHSLQRLVLPHDVLVDAANWIYIWGHWPVIAVTALWLYRSRPDGYLTLRDAMFLSGGIGVGLFLLFPVAPPRLVDLGLVDSVLARSHAYRALQPPSLTNAYAAFPSLHFGWDLLVGIALVTYARRPVVRLVGVLLPIAMAFAVIATANHYVIDVIAGGVLAVGSLLLVVTVNRRPRADRDAASRDEPPRRAASWPDRRPLRVVDSPHREPNGHPARRRCAQSCGSAARQRIDQTANRSDGRSVPVHADGARSGVRRGHDPGPRRQERSRNDIEP